jgi:predicted N-formylglutamate amidohydrolase
MYLVVGDNEPRSVTDASDYTIPVRGEQRSLHNVTNEIRRTLSLTKRFSAGGWDSSRD